MNPSQPEFKKRTPPGVKPVKREAQASSGSVRPVQRDRLSWHQFAPESDRYGRMPSRRCGASGLSLSAISLGAWETFGGYVGPEQARGCVFKAFNLGITHFDLANTYGTPLGRAEIMIGRILREMPRHELVIATKAGFPMWPGPYGEGGSRKALLSSIDQSLTRLGLDHVDIFYSHRPDPNTPLEETLRALDQIVRQGKALYLGLSNYPASLLAEACRTTRELNLTPISVAQVGYNMLERGIEQNLIPTAREMGLGIVGYSALAKGLLTAKYLENVPEGSRLARMGTAAQSERINESRVKVRHLKELAKARGQSLSQMALAWTLIRPEITSALIGVSEIDQVEENAKAMEKLAFTEDEVRRIEEILGADSPRI